MGGIPVCLSEMACFATEWQPPEFRNLNRRVFRVPRRAPRFKSEGCQHTASESTRPPPLPFSLIGWS